MRILFSVFRLLGAVQLALGVAFWTGHATAWIPLHELLGVTFVLLLWILGIIGAVKTRNAGLAVAAFGWGVLLAAIGFTQQRVLVGDLHWIVRVLHLVVVLAALPLAGLVVTRVRNVDHTISGGREDPSRHSR